jgi:hypothetical protein
MMAAGVSCGNQWPDCQTNGAHATHLAIELVSEPLWVLIRSRFAGASWYQITGSQQDWEFHFADVPVRSRPGLLSSLSVFHSKLVLYGAFMGAQGA